MKSSNCNIAVSVVIPCLNEEYAIRGCVTQAVAALNRLGLAGEVVVVDNGSTDATAQSAASAGAKVITCGARGYGAAVKAGVEASSGAIIVVGDGDGSYDFSDLAPFVYPVIENNCIVLGNRFHSDSPLPGAMPWTHQHIGNPLLTLILNLIYKGKVKDAHCGLRSFSRAVYDTLRMKTDGFELCSEMIIRALKHKVDIIDVPIVLHSTHPERRSKLRTYRDGVRHLLVILFMMGRRYDSRFLQILRLE